MTAGVSLPVKEEYAVSFAESHQSTRSRAVRTIVVGAVLAVLIGAGIAVALSSAAAGEQPNPSVAERSVEAVSPQLGAAREAAAATVDVLLPIANKAAGIASVETVAALQLDVAGLDTASRFGSTTDLDAAAAEVRASLAAFATSAAETCEAHLAAGAGGTEWVAEVTDDCAAVRAALTADTDVVQALTELEAVGAPVD
jgi:hypothetical protein